MTSELPPGNAAEPLPEERNWSVGAHIGALIGNVFALGQIVIPLVIWLVKKNDSPFIGENARESLNFQVSMTIYFLIAGALTLILVGYIFLVLLAVMDVVCVIIASVHASRGQTYRYPFSLRLIS